MTLTVGNARATYKMLPSLDPPQNRSVTPVSASHLEDHWIWYYSAPAGTSKTQLLILKNKSNKLGKQIATGPFSRVDTWTFYRSIYETAIGYVLPQSFFSRKDLK